MGVALRARSWLKLVVLLVVMGAFVAIRAYWEDTPLRFAANIVIALGALILCMRLYVAWRSRAGRGRDGQRQNVGEDHFDRH